tara:strand:+ start:871 stop:1188 length:318 start_codon:yes stop_codon:yes gene_type:complete
MEYILVILFVVLIVGVAVLAFALWKSLDTITSYEESTENIFNALSGLNESVNNVLQNEIYSNDPVIVGFVESIKNVEQFMIEISPALNYNELGEQQNGPEQYREA